MKIQVLKEIRPDNGFAYLAPTYHPELSAHIHPSSAVVLEDGVPLPGPANAIHDAIRQSGGGQYSFWRGYVYFSTIDNSDPRTNGRHYAISYTPSTVDTLVALAPQRWQRSWARILGHGANMMRRLSPSQLVWSGLYWLCFGWVLLRNRKIG